ncbi:MAG: hypothetical protein FJ272_02725, partial [Planctomycetes bacterium]|nr:hypothetical protein [Planctomycetota bacterium]
LNVTNVAWLTYNEIRLGDLTGIRMAAQVGDRQAVVRLTVDNWQFQWDPQKVGEKEQWFMPSHDRKAWPRMRVDMPWEQTELGQAWKAEHGEDYNGIGWYACRFDLPAPHQGQRLKIYFGAVDEAAKVWVNGQHVGDHPFVKPDDWKMPFEFDITQAVKVGANLVVVRVEDSAGAGGVYKPVWILRE